MHKCPKCGSPAYHGLHTSIECSNEGCEHYDERFARSRKKTEPDLRCPTEEELEDSTDDEPIFVPLVFTGPILGPIIDLDDPDPGPTGPDESSDELEIDWSYWDELGED